MKTGQFHLEDRFGLLYRTLCDDLNTATEWARERASRWGRRIYVLKQGEPLLYYEPDGTAYLLRR